jgi:predicted alpha/beta superfamily hydrolase
MTVVGRTALALLLSTSLLAAAPPAIAQATLVSESNVVQDDARKFVVRSKKLGRDMLIVVAAPRAGGIGVSGQRSAETKLPAIYALDNGWNIAGPVGQMMSFTMAMQPAYVVSVGYAGRDMRETDFSFHAITRNNLKLGDNGDNLLAFLTDELRPFLEARYSIDRSQSVLFGHSLGGLFVANVIARKPDAFAGYIIGSAGVEYDPSVIDGLTTAAKNGANKRIFIAAGEKEQPAVVEGVARIAAALSGSGSIFKIEKRVYANEGHISYYPRLAPEAFAFVLPSPIRYDAGITLAPRDLDRITGAYRMPDGRVTSVRREEDKLFVQMTGLGGQAELKPESATRFFIPGFDSVLVFDLPASGPATGVAMRVNGLEIRAVRQ